MTYDKFRSLIQDAIQTHFEWAHRRNGGTIHVHQITDTIVQALLIHALEEQANKALIKNGNIESIIIGVNGKL